MGLKDAREAAGLSINDLAGMLGVKADTVRTWESGRMPGQARIGPIAGALNLRPAQVAGWYFGDPGPDPPPVAPVAPPDAPPVPEALPPAPDPAPEPAAPPDPAPAPSDAMGRAGTGAAIGAGVGLVTGAALAPLALAGAVIGYFSGGDEEED